MLSDTAKLKRDRAIKRVQKSNVIQPLEWIMEHGISHSKKLEPKQLESDDTLLQSVEIKFGENTYAFLYDEFRTVHTPDDFFSVGKIKVEENGKTVFYASFHEGRYRNDWDRPKPYSIQCDTRFPDNVESIRSGNWMKDIPSIVTIEKGARTRAEKKRQDAIDLEKSREIDGNFD